MHPIWNPGKAVIKSISKVGVTQQEKIEKLYLNFNQANDMFETDISNFSNLK